MGKVDFSQIGPDKAYKTVNEAYDAAHGMAKPQSAQIASLGESLPMTSESQNWQYSSDAAGGPASTKPAKVMP